MTQFQRASAVRAEASVAPSGATSGFTGLGLRHELVRAVADEGYLQPTPIQARAIPPVAEGRDILGCAQTGTGKTAAFVLPVLERLARTPRTGKVRALVVAPTRELAAQIDERVAAYGRHLRVRHAVIYGGVGQRAQEDSLRGRPEILVATPGRLLDLMGQGVLSLDGVEILVLDEADRMLDMGFINDVRRIVAAVPKQRQTLLFSATVPAPIAQLVASVLRDPVRVDVAPEVTTAERVEQCVYFVPKADKRRLLEHLLREEKAERAIVFTRTKHGANRLAEQITRGGIESAAIHGNKSQGARERALEGFRTGSIPVLIATDLAARGIDVDGVTHVFNFDLPNVPESYVHRIGRTGRAGASGRAIAFCDADERALLRDIERFVRKAIPVSRAPVFEGAPMADVAPTHRTDAPRPAPRAAGAAPRAGSPAPRAAGPAARPAGAAPRPAGAAPRAAGSPTDANGAGAGASGRRRRSRRYRGARVG